MFMKATLAVGLLYALGENTINSFGGVAPACEVARIWADENPSEIPHSLFGFSLLEDAYAREAFSRNDSIGKVKLWSVHLSTLAATSTLDSAQQALVSRAVLALPEIFSSDSVLARVAVERLALDAQGLFSKREQFVLFGTLRQLPMPEDGRALSLRPAVFSSTVSSPAREYSLWSTVGPSWTSATCSCHDGSVGDFCDNGGPGNFCTSTPTCTSVADACGWFWSQDCNGRCGRFA